MIALGMTAVLACASVCVSAAAFTDVPEDAWYYQTVTAMTEKGLFAGKGEGLFCPDDTMTKAEFVTVVARMLYPSEEPADYAQDYTIWWDGYYQACVANGLFKRNELQYNTMESSIQRQEMALIAVRAMEYLGEDMTAIQGVSAQIPDFDRIGAYLSPYVEKAYGAGVILGDQDKNFNPTDFLTRAEASTVLYRITAPEARKPIAQ